MPEGSVQVGAGQRRVRGVALGVLRTHRVRVRVLRFAFVQVVRDGGVGGLVGHPASAPEGARPVHPDHQVRRNRLAGFVIAGKRGQHLRTVHPLLEHLRRSFDEVPFHGDAADAGPLLLAAQDPVHQMAELVEERHHIAELHQPGISCGRGRKIAHQDRFRDLLAANSIENRRHLSVAKFSWTRMHIQIETADHLAVVDRIPGFDRRIPGRDVFFLAEGQVEELGRGVEHSLFHLRVRQVAAYRLRVEIVLSAADELAEVGALIVSDLLRVGIGFLLLRQQHLEFAQHQGARCGIHAFDEARDIRAIHDHFIGGVVVCPRGIAEQRGNLVAGLHHLLEHIAVFRIRPGVEGHP